MNKKNCLLEIRNRKLLSAIKTIDNHEITLVIKLGDKVMKQSQFDILLAEINKINNKMDEGFNEVKTEFNTKIDEVKIEMNTRFDKIQIDMSEVKDILKKHDDLFVEHGWLSKSSFE